MHSLLKVVVLGAVLSGQSVVRSAAISKTTPLLASPPEITPAPSVEEFELLIRRQDPDAVSLAGILLTAVPVYLRQVAATNLPAVSSLIRDEFSHGQRPYWFNQLPEDVQAYLIKKFGPATARPTSPLSRSTGSGSKSASATTTGTTTGWSSETASLTSGWSDVSSGTRSGAATPSSSVNTETSSRPSTLSTSTSASSTSSSRSASSSSQSSHSSSLPSSPSASDSPPNSPLASSSGLSRKQKIGLGVGIPVGIVGAAVLFLGCCFLVRRQREKNINGSIPPSSPGFIPRFAFQDRSMETVEHQTPLTRHLNNSTQDLGQSSWEDEGIDPMEQHYNPYTTDTLGPPSNPYMLNCNNSTYRESNNNGPAVSYSNPGVPISNPAPIHYSPDFNATPQDPRPALTLHTHSSNRARGMRPGYTSLRSVAEVSEPDDNITDVESPVLGRHASPTPAAAAAAAAGRSLTPHSPSSTQIKRKPVGSPPPPSPPTTTKNTIPTSPAAISASKKLLRQTMPEHSNSSSSGLALSTSTTNTSLSSNINTTTTTTTTTKHPDITVSPVSPISSRTRSLSFAYDYIEDYGPEYYPSTNTYNSYSNVNLAAEDDDDYESAGTRRKMSGASPRTEWPLRSLVPGHAGGQTGKGGTLWDRVYEE